MSTKIDKETAELEFENFCEKWEIEQPDNFANDEEKNDFEKKKSRIIKSIMKGRFAMSGEKIDYELSLPVRESNKIIISRPKGKDYAQMDGFSDKHQMTKIESFMASICGVDLAFIKGLDGIDFKVVQDVASLFLVS